jgi:succinate dehydrogenase/fumarate reductase flavoprotein subunit
MGGNALTETVVFGKRAGEAAAAYAQELTGSPFRTPGGSREGPFAQDRTASASPSIDCRRELKRLREEMWADGGIIRNADGLERLLDIVADIETRVSKAGPSDGREAARALELRCAARVAGLIVAGALRRTESRGAHYRKDYPEQNDARWQVHLQVRKLPGGALDWRTVGC